MRKRWIVVLGLLGLYAGLIAAMEPWCRESAREGEAVVAAREAMDNGDEALAVEVLEAAYREDEAGRVLCGALGAAYVAEGRYEEAIRPLERAVEELEEDAHGGSWRLSQARSIAEAALFRAYFGAGRLESLRAFARGHPRSAVEHVRILLAGGEAQLAEEILSRNLDAESLDMAPWERRSLRVAWVTCPVAMGDYAEALRRCEELEDQGLADRLELLRLLISECADAEARAEAAESPAVAQAERLRLAARLIRLGLARRASEVLGVAGELPETVRPDALKLVAEGLELQGRRDESLDVWIRTAKAAPSDLDVRWQLARARKRAGRFEEARADLEAIVAEEPDRGLAWALLGDVARRQGDRDRALEAYRESVYQLSGARFEQGLAATDTSVGSPLVELVRACRWLAEIAEEAGDADSELLAWETVLELAFRPGKEASDPPANWLAEQARCRVYLLTGEEPPPLPGTDPASGGMLVTIR